MSVVGFVFFLFVLLVFVGLVVFGALFGLVSFKVNFPFSFDLVCLCLGLLFVFCLGVLCCI